MLGLQGWRNTCLGRVHRHCQCSLNSFTSSQLSWHWSKLRMVNSFTSIVLLFCDVKIGLILNSNCRNRFLWQPRSLNKPGPLRICCFSWPEPTGSFHCVFLVVSRLSVFVCERHGGLARCQTPAAPGTDRWEQRRPASCPSSQSAAQ